LHSYTAVRKAFGISIELVASLTRYLTEAFLAFEVGRYHVNLKVQVRDPKKVHIIDTGLRTVSLLSEREDWGRLAENAVYIELRRRGCEVFYFRNDTAEVDFVITELGKPKDVIQVCYSDMDNAKTRERELNSIHECLSSLGLKQGKILTRSYEDNIKFQNQIIQCIPMYRWLTS
jgi:predicted AAA+ superfamily ATPase